MALLLYKTIALCYNISIKKERDYTMKPSGIAAFFREGFVRYIVAFGITVVLAVFLLVVSAFLPQYIIQRQWHPTPVLLPGISQGAWWAAVHGVASVGLD